MTIISKTRLLIAFIVVIGALDLTFALVALRGGWLVEQNPIANCVLSAWGRWGLTGFKAISTLVACATIWVAIRNGWPKHRQLLTVAVVAAVSIQSFLLVHWVRCLGQFL